MPDLILPNRQSRRRIERLQAKDPGAADDAAFFATHQDRKLRIRKPFGTENEAEFNSLGSHQRERRRIIAAVVEPHLAARYGVSAMRIPFLLFADETVEDRDDVLRPILDGIMKDAAKTYGMGGRH